MNNSLMESPVETDQITESDVVSHDALAALNSSEIDVQISTAKRWPRSIKAFKQQALELACLDETIAGTMFYSLPRGGKRIEGPSVRLAEVVGFSWGNLRYAARIIDTDQKFITAQGMCYDLEKNIAASVEVKRRITDSRGRRYNDDMIQVTGNAALSIALRNAIFKVVPFGLVKPIYEEARLASLGQADTIANRRTRAMEWFGKQGITEQQVCEVLGRAGVDDITMDDLISLNGLRTAIKDGETTIDETFNKSKSAGKVKPSALNEKLKDGNGVDWDAAEREFHDAKTVKESAAVLERHLKDAADDGERNGLSSIHDENKRKLRG